MSTIDKQAMYWLLRQTGRELDPAERSAFDAWHAADIRHQGAFLRARVINNALDQATVQQTLRPTRERMAVEWAGASWKQPSSRRAFLLYGGGAACIAAVTVMSGYTKLSRHTVLSTAKGEFRRVPLEDRSVATINSASLVEVSFTRELRQLNLRRGEAWFDVAKDKSKPFLVESGDVRVRAVGTAFGVRRYDNGAEVLVSEGTVEVWSNEGAARRSLLTAGDRAFVPDRAERIAVTRQPGEVARKLAWKEGKLIFMNQTLGDAVADFNRYSLKKIVIADPSLNRKTLVGQYQIDAPELFARDVSAFLQVPVNITADYIMIGQGQTGRNS